MRTLEENLVLLKQKQFLTLEKILKLIKSDKKPYDILKNIDLQQNTINEWRTGQTNIPNDALAKIATYFNVTIDYLLGCVEPTIDNIDLSPIEQKLITDFRKLNKNGKSGVLSFINDQLNNAKK